MEENLRRDLHSPFSSDPQPLLHDCGAELTRTDSDSSSSSSSITVDNNNNNNNNNDTNTSKDFSHHHCSAAPLFDQSTKWTDQRHSLYLNSLEASFVNELHRSMRLRDWSLQNNMEETYRSITLQNSLHMSRQFLALQDGFQKNVSLERIEPILESTADSHVLAGSQLGLTSVDTSCTMREPNTYDHGLLRDEGIHARGSSTFSGTSLRSLEKHRICHSFHLESVGSTAEVTDQNFKDAVARSSSVSMAKRLKRTATDASSNDQVVPFGNIHTTDVSTSTNTTSKNKGQELISELPESFPFPKSDLHSFLSGS